MCRCWSIAAGKSWPEREMELAERLVVVSTDLSKRGPHRLHLFGAAASPGAERNLGSGDDVAPPLELNLSFCGAQRFRADAWADQLSTRPAPGVRPPEQSAQSRARQS